ncbi:hypothetical protein ANN_01232 [Periplaneta americana]|uniref:Uncharacterized protein n=1 Tax=Periplaneta americana TaxID=6978 RepID=A0ABQ8TUM6_PERAM|nr:hypothetical protein ANN_01232 [Periplaneta americana]
MAGLCEGGNEPPGSLKANKTDRLDTETCANTLLSTDLHIRTDHVRYTLRYLHCFSVVSCPHPSDSAFNGILLAALLVLTCRHRVPPSPFLIFIINLTHTHTLTLVHAITFSIDTRVAQPAEVVCNLKMGHSPAIYPQYTEPESHTTAATITAAAASAVTTTAAVTPLLLLRYYYCCCYSYCYCYFY